MSIWSKGKPRDLPKVDFEVRFMYHVETEPMSGCWLWIGSNTANAKRRTNIYPLAWAGRGYRGLAHKLSYEHFIGPVLPGYEMDHRCTQSLCVNPQHLEPVTPAENRRRQRIRTVIIPWRV